MACAFNDPSFEELSCYLDGELPTERLEEIDRWLARNPAGLKQLQQIRSVERELRKAAASAALSARNLTNSGQ